MKEFKLDNPLLSQAEYEQMYHESFADKDGFWSKIANQQLTWFKNFSKVKNTNYEGDVSIKWFEDGELNVCYNCVDRHLETRRDQIALIWEGNHSDDSKSITYGELYTQVCQLANVLKEQGIKISI